MDMDKRWKPNVRNAILTLHDMYKEIGVEYKEHEWNPKYKGIDDYMYAKSKCIKSKLLAA